MPLSADWKKGKKVLFPNWRYFPTFFSAGRAAREKRRKIVSLKGRKKVERFGKVELLESSLFSPEISFLQLPTL